MSTKSQFMFKIMQFNPLYIMFVSFLCDLLLSSKSFQTLGNKISEVVEEGGMQNRTLTPKRNCALFLPTRQLAVLTASKASKEAGLSAPEGMLLLGDCGKSFVN